MGKRKRSRSRDKDYDSILKKVRKLEQQLREHQRRESSSSLEEHNVENVVNVDFHQSESVQSPLRDMDMDEIEKDPLMVENQTNNTPVTNNDETTGETSLEPDILEILGDDITKSTAGEKLHKDISNRWQHILTNGLSKETKTELIKLYAIPENCNRMKAPRLNLEIKAALSEINLKKDNFSENKQNQLSSGIAAMGKALNIVLNSSSLSSQELIKYLSDAGRLLCDYHYRESQSRRYAIINTLNKQTRDTIKYSKLDEYLFGSELAEHLKSAKAIEKSGTELKQVYSYVSRPPAKPAANTRPQRGALNARGASRAAASETRPYTAARRPADPPTTRDRHEASTSRGSYHHRQRGRGRR